MNILKIKSSLGGLEKKGSEKGVDLVVSALEDFYVNEFNWSSEVKVSEVPIDISNIEETNARIFEMVKNFEGVIIGGDHSITYPAFSAFSSRFSNPGLIVFDAHPDCENDFKPPSHEDYLRVLISEGKVKASNVILVAVRNMHRNESNFIKEKGIKVFKMKDIFGRVDEVCDDVMEMAREWDGLYLSLDIDAVDPAFAPGTGYCEPGGLSSREMIYFVQRLKLLKNLKVVDLVEINPDLDVNGKTVKLGAKLIKELMKD